jgi:hypothetical protein
VNVEDLERYRRDIKYTAPVDSLDGGFQLAALAPNRWREGPAGVAVTEVATLGVERMKAPGSDFPDGRPYRPQPLKHFVEKLGTQIGLSWK